ncbi:MAG: TetR family transcriptional regulator C-terminal domain-containing protein [Acidimicrobiia bacterium]|nr:TetR family transcriptional regulator C-terminal domain-containing protein [Acidimicrobiia bacterium]
MATAETRDGLVRATQEAIRQKGMSGATAREIAGRASANLAAIPYHFGSKDDLVAEALLAEARELVAPVLALLGRDEPGPERAAAAVALLNDLFDRSRDRVPVYLGALAAAPHRPRVQDGLRDLWGELRTGLAHDIEAQVAAGVLPAWVAPDAMAELILSVVNGVVVASALGDDGPAHRDVAAQFLMLLLAARPPDAS